MEVTLRSALSTQSAVMEKLQKFSINDRGVYIFTINNYKPKQKKKEKGEKGKEKKEKGKKGKKKGEKREKRKKKVFDSHREICKTFLGKKLIIFSPGGKNIIFFP